MPAPNAISFDKLTRIIGTPRAPLLLDVRSEEDFARREWACSPTFSTL